MPVDVENLRKFREQKSIPDRSLLAMPVENQRNIIIVPRNKNPVIKDIETEILNMKEGDWNSLSQEQKEMLRRQAWQK